MKPSEALREARIQLFERGWAKGDFVNHEGNVCSIGAINVTTHDAVWIRAHEDPRTLNEKARGYLRQAIADRFPAWRKRINTGQADVPEWNDTRRRTFDEVVDTFEYAAKLAELDGE